MPVANVVPAAISITSKTRIICLITQQRLPAARTGRLPTFALNIIDTSLARYLRRSKLYPIESGVADTAVLIGRVKGVAVAVCGPFAFPPQPTDPTRLLIDLVVL